ncbi:MAG: hypothetical protein VW600_15240 [Ferrovibrio sp.]
MRILTTILLLVLIAGRAAAADLPRDRIVLRSALSVDIDANTVTLPLFRGRAGQETVWYILTDASDAGTAMALGLVHAPLLAYAEHVQPVHEAQEGRVFQAAPDFSARRRLQPGPQGFPPAAAVPGATAPAAYSPFIRAEGSQTVLNAPIVATGNGPFDVDTHGNTADRVLAIDTEKRTVTLLLSHGYAEGRRVVYISTEASDPAAAALERATYVPALGEGSADIALLAVISAPEQGLSPALRRGEIAIDAKLGNSAGLGSPYNILSAFPSGKTARGYSPSWRVTLLQWQHQAPVARLTDQKDVWALVKAKQLLGPDGGAPQPTEMIVNCPVIAWLDEPLP